MNPMTQNISRTPALQPEDLATFFVQRANAGDVEGLVALYEPEAVVAGPNGTVVRGHEAIRAFYAELLAQRIQFEAGEQRPALQQGEIALTSTRLLNGTVTAEIARQQSDGTWLWAVDQPVIARRSEA
jgi:ketosteroid isomerase-like protein